MSWQAYVDTSLTGTGKIDKAAIVSRAGDSVWAISPNFNLGADELKSLAAGFQDPPSMFGTGIHLAGQKYITIRAEGRSIYGKLQKEGIICVSTKLAILISHYPETTLPGEAAKITEALADYLAGAGY
ncbi:profilin [Schizosaccharomyces japonicus yFS275]|uniref:Profilin n=1 Tax=Schizosaccharomyces japonicus (strain yFS275 / FY16936) TaxID=402676 RepID=B6K8A4_SCHJY|nr:profilin [Schizosaccharomyces japonicus yFS275]EEB09758.1 profilin [Schizosaccharomyces japonicus yFS275]